MAPSTVQHLQDDEYHELLCYARRRLQGQHSQAAEDVVQEVSIALADAQRASPPAAPTERRMWLFAAVKNCCNKYLANCCHRRRVEVRYAESLDAQSRRGESDADGAAQAVRDLIQRTPLSDREQAVLYYSLDGRKPSEIARLCDLSVQSVYDAKRRALQKCRDTAENSEDFQRP